MVRRLALASVTLALSCMLLGAASTAGAAQLSLAPADTTVSVGDTFTLRVVCDAVPDLKGLQSAYSFPASRLQLLGMPAGDVLTGSPGPWFEFVIPDVSAPTDTAWIDAAKLGVSTSGPGVVAYIQFQALIVGDAPLQCVLAEIRDSFNVSLAPTCLAGIVRVIGPTPAERRSWGRLKVRYR